MQKKKLVALSLMFLPFMADSGLAQAEDGFVTPSGNIACYFEQDKLQLVCEISETDWSPSVEPDKDCLLDQGKQAILTTNGLPRSGWWCRGDTWLSQDIPVLAYGKNWSRSGVSCNSQSSGLTCRNLDGHGWRLSRREVQFD